MISCGCVLCTPIPMSPRHCDNLHQCPEVRCDAATTQARSVNIPPPVCIAGSVGSGA